MTRAEMTSTKHEVASALKVIMTKHHGMGMKEILRIVESLAKEQGVVSKKSEPVQTRKKRSTAYQKLLHLTPSKAIRPSVDIVREIRDAE